ncbi:MAG: hypothetical protein H7067_15630 [Burkholderiales bacterium]|nr:hypothetical protein [Opitutaceae bacterium]
MPKLPPARIALATLLLFAAVCGAWLLSLDPHAHFTTDVAELLPSDERDPEARLALSLSAERQARVVLIALDAPAGTAPTALATAARVFADSLQNSPAFAAAHPQADTTWQNAVGRQLHARRLDLLLPAWLAQQRAAAASPEAAPAEALAKEGFSSYLATRAIATLDAHLASPASAALYAQHRFNQFSRST